VQNCTKKGLFDFLHLRVGMRFCGEFASISVQNRQLEGESNGVCFGA
jgi:hypothetical protein